MRQCICGGCANGSPCGYDVCPICSRHYTDSGNHVTPKRGTRQYPCGHTVVSAALARGRKRSFSIRARYAAAERAALARWNGVSQ